MHYKIIVHARFVCMYVFTVEKLFRNAFSPVVNADKEHGIVGKWDMQSMVNGFL